MKDSSPDRSAAATIIPATGMAAAVALVLVLLLLLFLLLSSLSVCGYIYSNVNDMELNYFCTSIIANVKLRQGKKTMLESDGNADLTS